MLKHLREIEIEVSEVEEWLLQCRFGALDVAIVICRLLPLEERYYFLLPFAPAASLKWREFAKIVIEQERIDLLEILVRLKPVELTMVIKDLKQNRNLPKSKIEAYKIAYKNLLEMIKDMPEDERRDILSIIIVPEKLVAGMTSEQLDLFSKLIEDRKKQQKN